MEYRFDEAEWYRGTGLSPGSISESNGIESARVSTIQPTVETKRTEGEASNDEREAKLEMWMEEVKAFIRNIDVNKL